MHVACILSTPLYGLAGEKPEDGEFQCFPVWIKADETAVQSDDGSVFRLKMGETVLCVKQTKDRARVRKHSWDQTVREGWIPISAALGGYEACQFFTQIIEKQPKEVRAYLGRQSAMELYFPSDRELRFSDLNTAIHLAPNCSEAYAMRAVLYQHDDRFKEALADYTRVVQLEPTLGLPYAWRGGCLRDMGRDEDAIEDYTKAIARMRPNADVYRERAKLFQRIGEPSKALEDLAEAERLEPGSSSRRLRRDALLALGRYEQVLSEMNVAIRKQPEVAHFFACRAESYAQTGRHAEALADFERAMHLRGEDQNTQYIVEWYARFLATCADPTVQDAKKAVALAVTACRFAGTVSRKDAYDLSAAMRADRTKFEEDWVREGWRDWRCLDSLAAAYAASGDFDKAVRWQRKAIQVAPKRLHDDLHGRLQLYEKQQPYRIVPKSNDEQTKGNGDA
jgi:tetratricopeptide (TPR) repeat protein